MSLPPGVHVILGDSAAGIFRRVFHPGDRLIIDLDVVSCGPTPRCDDLDAWCDLRRAYVTSADPTDIARFGERHPTANQWLKQAMQLMLRRFPDEQSGLSFWDLALLKQVHARGPRAVRVIGYTMGDAYDDADLIGDWILFGRLLRLSDPGLPVSLLATTGDRTNMREVAVTLTPFGLEVLEGRASYYPANPIDDWVAGVKLSSADGALWFNDAGTLVSQEAR